MEGVPENALQPLYFVAEMLDTETSQLACADTQTHVFHVGNTARNRVFHGDNPIRACPDLCAAEGTLGSVIAHTDIIHVV